MTTITDFQQTPQEKQQLYLEKVNQFFWQVKEWLPEPFETVPTENALLEDKTGKYEVPRLSIIKKGVSTPDSVIANLLPEGISFLTGEDLIEIKGAWDDEEVAYIRKQNLIHTVRHGKECLMDEGFEKEGWYWIIINQDKIRPITKEIFFEIIRRVSNQPVSLECKAYLAPGIPSS